MMQDQMTGMASGMPQDTSKAFRVCVFSLLLFLEIKVLPLCYAVSKRNSCSKKMEMHSLSSKLLKYIFQFIIQSDICYYLANNHCFCIPGRMGGIGDL